MELDFCGKKVGQIRECPPPIFGRLGCMPSWQIYRDEETDFAFDVIANEQVTV